MIEQQIFFWLSNMAFVTNKAKCLLAMMMETSLVSWKQHNTIVRNGLKF